MRNPQERVVSIRGFLFLSKFEVRSNIKRKPKEVNILVKISIFCCSKVTQKLGCSSTQCLCALKNRIGAYSRHTRNAEVELVGLVNCPGCPSEIGPERLAKQIKNLAEYQVNEIYFSSCINTFCVFRYDYQALIERDYPEVEVIFDAGRPHLPPIQIEFALQNN